MNIQEFIENNIQLIDNNEYQKLYTLIHDASVYAADISKLTHILLESGINPLEYMSTMPTYYSAYLSIDSVDIPSNIVYIEESAFEYCDKLTSVVLPQSVKTIDEFVFYSCSKLTRVTYLGTMEQFQEIDIARRWADDTITQIECTDGVLARVWKGDRFVYQRVS